MRTRLLAAAALAAAAVSTGTTAADAACFGTDRTIVICVNPPGVNPTGGTIDDCVHVGLPECVPVSVPYPTTEPASEPLVTCQDSRLVVSDRICQVLNGLD